MFAGCRGGVRAGTTVRVSDNKGIGCKSVRRHASPKLGGCNCHKDSRPFGPPRPQSYSAKPRRALLPGDRGHQREIERILHILNHRARLVRALTLHPTAHAVRRERDFVLVRAVEEPKEYLRSSS